MKELCVLAFLIKPQEMLSMRTLNLKLKFVKNFCKMATLTKKDLLTPITEEKQCSSCIHVINYGWHAVKAECEITHQSWGNYTGENMDRRNAEHCEHFCPKEEVWSNSAQIIVKSKDINWI